ncbi:MAG: hypothetical protein LBS10_03920, partial [Gracilibacteraceae bacterium]|nr:hypothetical protein [Gracilibacteraceae bacterium]
MKQESSKKWHWALALCLIAALSGTAWAVDSLTYSGSTDNSMLQDLPGWISRDVLGDYWTVVSDSLFPTGETGNTVTINYSAGTDAATVSLDFVGGAQSSDVDVSKNTIEVKSGWIKSAVIGAITRNKNAMSNDVTISGGTVGSADASLEKYALYHGDVSGGYVTSGEGYAYDKTVTISGGTIFGAVIGGVVQGPVGDPWHKTWMTAGTGNAENNKVDIKGGILNNGGLLNNAIFGGYVGGGNAKKNQVNISGTPLLTSVDQIVGGYSSAGSALENSVYIGNNVLIGTTLTAGSAAHIIGGKADGGTMGAIAGNPKSADCNSVIINANITAAGYIYGGFTRSQGTSASNNWVGLLGGKIEAPESKKLQIFGGWVSKDSAVAKENIVEIAGSTTFGEGVSLYGWGNAFQNTEHTGNTLILNGVKNITVESVQSFDRYEFNLPANVGSGALISADEADLGSEATFEVSNFPTG